MSSKIRLLHGCPQNPYLDAFCGSAHLCQNIAYNGCSDYCEIDYGSYNISVCSPQSRQHPLVDAYAYLPDGGYHTAVISGDRDNANLFVVPDSFHSDGTSRAFLRFVNLAYDAPCLDFRFTDGAFIIAKNIEYQEVTQYYPVTPSTYQMQATLCNSGFVVLSAPAITLQAGRSYTLYITGTTRAQPYCTHQLCLDGRPPQTCAQPPWLPTPPCNSSCQNTSYPDYGSCTCQNNNPYPNCSPCQDHYYPDYSPSCCQNNSYPNNCYPSNCSSCQGNYYPDCGSSTWPDNCHDHWDYDGHCSGGCGSTGWSSDAITYGSSYTHYYTDNCRQ